MAVMMLDELDLATLEVVEVRIADVTPLGTVYLVAKTSTRLYSLSLDRFHMIASAEPVVGASVTVRVDGNYVAAIGKQ